MSKKSKTRAAEDRKKKKRACKEANRAKYAAWRDMGQNGKRAKIVRKRRRRGIRIVRHPQGACGNVGCARCFPPKKKGA